jgi:tetratricopeptide (TPR) repeat protein
MWERSAKIRIGMCSSRKALSAILSLCLAHLMGIAQQSFPSDAIGLEQQGKLAEAATAWRSIVARNPKDAAAFASLGLVLSEQEQYAEAVPAYRRAIALNPKLRGVSLNLGLALFDVASTISRLAAKQATP